MKKYMFSMDFIIMDYGNQSDSTWYCFHLAVHKHFFIHTSEPTFVLLVMCRIEETLSLHSTFIIFTLNKPLDDANISNELLVD